MTWKVTCTYSQFLSQKTPTCCVSLSSFYNDTIVNCPTCTCGCRNNLTQPGSCVEWVLPLVVEFYFSCKLCSSLICASVLFDRSDSPYLAYAIDGPGKSSFTPLVQCTSHMCPIRVHWHVKLNYREYWRAKITVTNFNYRMNYTHWNLVMQHPNFNNLTQIFSFNYKALTPYGTISKLLLHYFPCAIAYLADLIWKVCTRDTIGCIQASGVPSLSMMVLSVSGYEAPDFLK